MLLPLKGLVVNIINRGMWIIPNLSLSQITKSRAFVSHHRRQGIYYCTFIEHIMRPEKILNEMKKNTSIP